MIAAFLATSLWTHVTAAGAFATLVRLACFVNLIRNERRYTRVPQRVVLAVVAFAMGCLCICLLPFYGYEFDWPFALTSWGAATYVWLDRRRPVQPHTEQAPRGVPT